MLNAHPEHYAVVREPDGRVSVLETIGGWKVPGLIYARFTQDERDAAEPPIQPCRYASSAIWSPRTVRLGEGCCTSLEIPRTVSVQGWVSTGRQQRILKW